MKSNHIILFFFLINTLYSSGQIDSVRSEFNKKIIAHTNGSGWTIDTLDEGVITVFRIDTFSVCSGFNPIRGHKRQDTLYLRFKFEEGWNQTKIDTLAQFNLEILKPIVPKYIAYYDSIGWGKARIKKRTLLEQPKTAVLHDWFNSNYLSEEERISLFRLVRLPDTIIGTVGVFNKKSFPPYYIIQPESLEKEVDILLRKLNDNVLPTSTILRNEGYFLLAPFKEGP